MSSFALQFERKKQKFALIFCSFREQNFLFLVNQPVNIQIQKDLPLLKFFINQFLQHIVERIIDLIIGFNCSYTDIGIYFVDSFVTNVSFMLIVLFEILYFGNPQRFAKFKKQLRTYGNHVPWLIKYSQVKCCRYTYTVVIILLVVSFISQIKSSFDYTLLWALAGWIISISPFFMAIKIYIQHRNDEEIKESNLETELITRQ